MKKHEQECRMDLLLNGTYAVIPFKALERPYQLAISRYMALDGDAWSDSIPANANWPTRKQQLQGLQRLLPKLAQKYGEVPFGVAILQSERVRESVMQDPEIAHDFKSWDDYHSWYLSVGDMPRHRKAHRWPVILSDDNTETLQDGWHRLHNYLRRGDTTIPSVFFPDQRHLHQA